jgi:hypothetical protein
VCGGELSMQACGGGEPTRWACDGQEDDPEHPGRLRWKAGRELVDEHYVRSEFIDRRRGGDELVMDLVRRFKNATSVGGRPSLADLARRVREAEDVYLCAYNLWEQGTCYDEIFDVLASLVEETCDLLEAAREALLEAAEHSP